MSDRNLELYRRFIHFVQEHSQAERMAVNRKVYHVVFWCFLLPAALIIAIIVLNKIGLLPDAFRAATDWVMVFFPVSYTIYFLSSEVVRDLPLAVRKGGIAAALRRPVAEAQWRMNAIKKLEEILPAGAREWSWVATNFRMDLRAMRSRNRYLTLLAGAVFFLIMEGIDALDGRSFLPMIWTPATVVNLLEYLFDKLALFVGLAFFLTVLYLSGSQVHQYLERFQNCLELIREKKEEDHRPG